MEPKSRWGVLAVAALAQLTVVLDVSVLNIALPEIGHALALSAKEIQWVAGGYSLAFAAALLAGARVADTHGARRVFVIGTVAFVAASVAGGLAPTGSVLIAARITQGLAAAVVSPATFTLLTTTYPEGSTRTRALAAWTAVSVAGGGVGNIVGGALTEYVSWRSVLLINLPIGIAVLLMTFRYVPQPVLSNRPSVDLSGAALGAAALGGCTLAVSELGEDGSTSVAFAAAILALVGTIGFVVRLRRSPNPLVPARLLTNRILVTGNVLTLLTGAVFQVPIWFFLTYRMQQSLHLTPVQTAFGFLPLTAAVVITSIALTPRLLDRHPPHRIAAAGAALASIGLMCASIPSTDSDAYLPAIGIPSILIGVGGGLLNTPLATAVSSGVAPDDAGAASGLMNTSKQFGGALGLAALTLATGLADFRLACAIMAVLLAITAASSFALLRSTVVAR